jgi:hypothetical protein
LTLAFISSVISANYAYRASFNKASGTLQEIKRAASAFHPNPARIIAMIGKRGVGP